MQTANESPSLLHGDDADERTLLAVKAQLKEVENNFKLRLQDNDGPQLKRPNTFGPTQRVGFRLHVQMQPGSRIGLECELRNLELMTKNFDTTFGPRRVLPLNELGRQEMLALNKVVISKLRLNCCCYLLVFCCKFSQETLNRMSGALGLWQASPSDSISGPNSGVLNADEGSLVQLEGWAFQKISESEAKECVKWGMFHTAENLKTLKPGAWLDDEIMNSLFYALLICNQDRMHYFNSLVYELMKSGYSFETFKNYANDVNLSSKDFIFFIINVRNVHWILAVAVVSSQKILLLDSMGCGNEGVQQLEVIKIFLRDIGKTRIHETKLDVDWQLIVVNPGLNTFPVQMDGHNCGLHVYALADRILAKLKGSEMFPISGYSSSGMIQLRGLVRKSLEQML
jgi:hypothetical protein